jgi:transposase
MGCEKHPQPAEKLTYPGPVFVQRGSTTARFFAWLGNYRPLLVRHEFYGLNFLAYVQLACAVIWLKQL